jgi:peptide/nickel transport system substrate-binding protein
MADVTPPVPRSSNRSPCAHRALLAGLLAMTLAGPATTLGAGELRVGVPRLPVTLDPTAATTPIDAMLARLLFEGLVTVDDRGEIAPALAGGWTVSRDGLTWTFRLREDIRLSTGVALSTDDVVAALAPRISAEEPAEPAPAWVRPFRGATRVVQEIRRGDAPGTVQLQLSQPYAALLAVLAHPALAVAAAAEDAGSGPLGTGPYRVTEAGPGRIVLDTVPGPGRAAPRSERIVIVEVTDEAAALTGLALGGALDVWLPAAAPSAPSPGLQVLSGPSWQIGLLALRSDQGVFRQKAARQAAALALDPAALQQALGWTARPLAQYLPPGAWAVREVPRSFDLGRARKLLAQLGAADLGLTLMVPDLTGGPEGARLAEALRASLAAAGFRPRVRIEPADAAAAALRRGESDLGVIETRLEVDDPHILLRPLLASDAATPGSATNVAFLRSPLVDGMLGRASQLGFRPERLRLYQRLQAHLAEEVPYLPLYVRLQWLVARPEVRDAGLQPSGLHRLERFWVEPAAPPPASAAPAAPGAETAPAEPAPEPSPSAPSPPPTP